MIELENKVILSYRNQMLLIVGYEAPNTSEHVCMFLYCDLVDWYRRFGGTCCHTQNLEAIHSSETLVINQI
jgi:hypothetical protein